MKIVIIESPYAGDIDRNVAYARAAMRDSLLRGEAPYASHLLYTQDGVLDDLDNEQREIGIAAGWAFVQVADAIVVYADLGISEGMSRGVLSHIEAGFDASKIYLLCSPSVEAKCQAKRPQEWSAIWSQKDERGGRNAIVDSGVYEHIGFTDRLGNLRRGTGYGLAPAALAALIWTSEYGRFIGELESVKQGPPTYTCAPRYKADCIKFVAETYPLPVIEQAACRVLLRRKWDRKTVSKPTEDVPAPIKILASPKQFSYLKNPDADLIEVVFTDDLESGDG